MAYLSVEVVSAVVYRCILEREQQRQHPGVSAGSSCEKGVVGDKCAVLDKQAHSTDVTIRRSGIDCSLPGLDVREEGSA